MVKCFEYVLSVIFLLMSYSLFGNDFTERLCYIRTSQFISALRDLTRFCMMWVFTVRAIFVLCDLFYKPTFPIIYLFETYHNFEISSKTWKYLDTILSEKIPYLTVKVGVCKVMFTLYWIGFSVGIIIYLIGFLFTLRHSHVHIILDRFSRRYNNIPDRPSVHIKTVILAWFLYRIAIAALRSRALYTLYRIAFHAVS